MNVQFKQFGHYLIPLPQLVCGIWFCPYHILFLLHLEHILLSQDSVFIFKQPATQ